jgi:hypothetical protein
MARDMKEIAEKTFKEIAENKKEGFEEMLKNPAISFLISMIPEATQPDLIKTVLRTVYDAGFDRGESASMTGMMKAVMSANPANGS